LDTPSYSDTLVIRAERIQSVVTYSTRSRIWVFIQSWGYLYWILLWIFRISRFFWTLASAWCIMISVFQKLRLLRSSGDCMPSYWLVFSIKFILS